jgi:hypothetical protein
MTLLLQEKDKNWKASKGYEIPFEAHESIFWESHFIPDSKSRGCFWIYEQGRICMAFSKHYRKELPIFFKKVNQFLNIRF